MKWTQLTSGPCGAKASLTGVDPNLVWADATGFADFRRVGAFHPDPFPVLVELIDGGGASAASPLERLHAELVRYGGAVPAIYPRTLYPAALHCTAWFSSAYCMAVLDDPHHRLGQMIKRFQLQLPVIPERPREVRPVPAPSSSGPRARSTGLLVGVIDSGCPFAHADLRDDTGLGTRILNIWDQDSHPSFTSAVCGGVTPADLGHGCEISQKQLNLLMQRHTRSGVVDEDACYAETGESLLRARYMHGAAVLGLLTGRHFFGARRHLIPEKPAEWDALDQAARAADVVFVQTPRDHVQDSSSAALERYVLEGLRYIVSCAGDDTERIVVNISDGSMRGTHDGQSIIERAITELVDEQAALGRELCVVLAAGNAYEDRRHAQIDVPDVAGPNEHTLTMQLPHGNETPTYLLMRVPAGQHAPRVSLDAACLGGVSPQVEPGQAWGLFGGAAHPVLGVVYPQRDPQEAMLALVAFRPTSCNPELAGRWKVMVRLNDRPKEPLHFYLVLGQRNSGGLARTQQPRFVDVDETYDPGRPLRHSAEDPVKPPFSPIRRRGTLSSFTTAKPQLSVWVVGSMMCRPQSYSPYSAAGPAAGTGGRQDIDLVICTDESPALMGMRSMGVRSGEVVRVSGTSFAAPQIARLLANGLFQAAASGTPYRDRRQARVGQRILQTLRLLVTTLPRRFTSGPGATPR